MHKGLTLLFFSFVNLLATALISDIYLIGCIFAILLVLLSVKFILHNNKDKKCQAIFIAALIINSFVIIAGFRAA